MNKTLFLGAALIVMTGGSAGVNAENADIPLASKTYRVNGVSFTMITIPAVTDGTLGYGEYNVNPTHTVNLSSYRIGGIDIDIYITQYCRSGSFILPIFMQVVSDYAWHAGCHFCIFRIAYHTAIKKIRRGL